MSSSAPDSAVMEAQSRHGGDERCLYPWVVQVHRAGGGRWEAVLPAGNGAIRCDSLAEAELAGRVWAKANTPSELIVRDAYHRVVIRQRFRAADDAGAHGGTDIIV